jgi:hypothetical protein
MKRALRWVLRGVAGLALLLIIIWLCRSPLLKAFTEYRIHDAMGIRAHIGELRASAGFSTASVKGFRMFNPAEFGPEPLLVAPELFLEWDRQPAASGRIRFKEARVHLAEFNIVRAPDGKMNVDAIERAVRERLRKRKKTRLMEVDFSGIDRLYVTLGTLNFIDRQQPDRSRAFHLGVTNELVTTIQSEEDFHAWVASFAVRLAMQEYFRNPGAGKQQVLEWLTEALRRKQ